MNILDTIVAHKRRELETKKSSKTIAVLQSSEFFSTQARSLSQALLHTESTGIIAEFKRKSPSKGIIKQHADVIEITSCYCNNGAAALSVLTDENFFGGADKDLLQARRNAIPILRKDFVVDEYQIIEAKSIGADVILLIAACLTPKEVKGFAQLAASLGLEVILELHADYELEHVCEDTKIIGINNRDLKTFTVDIDRSLQMAAKIPNDKIKIAESGINRVKDIVLFRQNGFKGFLIGEHFMRQPDTCAAFKTFIDHLKAAS